MNRMAEATFLMPKLDWSEPSEVEYALWLDHYRVLALRAVTVKWQLGDGMRLLLCANFSERAMQPPDTAEGWQLLYSSDAPGAPISASFFTTRAGGRVNERTRYARSPGGACRHRARYTDALGQPQASDETLLALTAALGFRLIPPKRQPSSKSGSGARSRARARSLIPAEDPHPGLPVRLADAGREIAGLPARKRRGTARARTIEAKRRRFQP